MAEMVSTQLKLSASAKKVLEKRYLKKDEEGRVIEGPENLFKRVAQAVASVELNYGKSDSDIGKLEDRFYDLMTTLKFLPNSPTLMITEKLSDAILGLPPLPRIEAEFWTHLEFANCQREFTPGRRRCRYLRCR